MKAAYDCDLLRTAYDHVSKPFRKPSPLFQVE